MLLTEQDELYKSSNLFDTNHGPWPTATPLPPVREDVAELLTDS
jgi:hypothetical protein